MNLSVSRVLLYAGRLHRSIWFAPTVYTLGSLLVLAAAPLFAPVVPARAPSLFNADTLEQILGILASSMLAVAIFSLGTMVSALQAAASAATPRARVLLTEDRTAQNAISTFIGAFIYSILAIIVVSTDYYDDRSTVILFAVTIGIVVIVIVTLISWIARLSRLGGVAEAVRMVERAANRTFSECSRTPCFGGKPLGSVSSGVCRIELGSMGTIQHVDWETLGELAESLDTEIHVLARPGALADAGTAIAASGRSLADEDVDAVRNCFVVGTERTFEEDPLFGVVVLSEIGQRALSPAVNDPGTAIDVINTIVRVARHWRKCDHDGDGEVRFPRLFVPELDPAQFVIDGFRAIARDGAGNVEVATAVQKALAMIRDLDPDAFADPAARMSREVLDRCRAAMDSDDDVAMVEEIALQAAQD